MEEKQQNMMLGKREPQNNSKITCTNTNINNSRNTAFKGNSSTLNRAQKLHKRVLEGGKSIDKIDSSIYSEKINQLLHNIDNPKTMGSAILMPYDQLDAIALMALEIFPLEKIQELDNKCDKLYSILFCKILTSEDTESLIEKATYGEQIIFLCVHLFNHNVAIVNTNMYEPFNKGDISILGGISSAYKKICEIKNSQDTYLEKEEKRKKIIKDLFISPEQLENTLSLIDNQKIDIKDALNDKPFGVIGEQDSNIQSQLHNQDDQNQKLYLEYGQEIQDIKQSTRLLNNKLTDFNEEVKILKREKKQIEKQIQELDKNINNKQLEKSNKELGIGNEYQVKKQNQDRLIGEFLAAPNGNNLIFEGIINDMLEQQETLNNEETQQIQNVHEDLNLQIDILTIEKNDINNNKINIEENLNVYKEQGSKIIAKIEENETDMTNLKILIASLGCTTNSNNKHYNMNIQNL